MKSIITFSCLAFLAAVTSGVEFKCRHEERVGFRAGSTVQAGYGCPSATLVSGENPTTVTEIGGTHLAGKTNADVIIFGSVNIVIQTGIPSGIEKFFPNIQVFSWVSGNLSSIDSSTFKPWPYLLHLNLAYNKLVTLDGDLFQYTRKLRNICFSNNKLEHVGHGLLTGLPDLWYAQFSYNPCIDAIFDTPPQIEELKLQLPIKCPPLTTPTTPNPTTTTISTTSKSNECPDTCAINEEAQDMQKRIKKLEKQMKKLKLSEED